MERIALDYKQGLLSCSYKVEPLEYELINLYYEMSEWD